MKPLCVCQIDCVRFADGLEGKAQKHEATCEKGNWSIFRLHCRTCIGLQFYLTLAQHSGAFCHSKTKQKLALN